MRIINYIRIHFTARPLHVATAQDAPTIDPVVVPVESCHRCGAELDTGTFEDREYPRCPSCDLLVIQRPAPVVQAIVHDGGRLLLLDEPVSWKADVLSFPGGNVNYDEPPREVTLRELEEETTLAAEPADLDLLTVSHSEGDHQSWWLVTYTLEWDLSAADLEPEGEEFEIELVPIADVLDDPDLLLPAAYERVERAFGEGDRD